MTLAFVGLLFVLAFTIPAVVKAEVSEALISQPVEEKAADASDSNIVPAANENMETLGTLPSDEQCKTLLVSADLEQRYKKLQNKMKEDLSSGVPHELKNSFIKVREKIDLLAVQLFELEEKDNQSVNQTVNQVLVQLEQMIGLVPKVNELAPQMRDQYVIPLTNIDSLRADHEHCLMQAAIRKVSEDSSDSGNDLESSFATYNKLTEELERLNNDLYKLQTTKVEKFIGLRDEVLQSLAAYNNGQKGPHQLSTEIPEILNILHRDIEEIMPGLEVPKVYYSLLQ